MEQKAEFIFGLIGIGVYHSQGDDLIVLILLVCSFSFPFSFFLLYMPSALYFAAGALGFRKFVHGSKDKNV